MAGRRRLLFWRQTLSATLLLLATACSHVAPPVLTPEGPGPEWPLPPDPPRIRYIGELRGASDMHGDEGNLSRFFSALFGESERVELVAPRCVVRIKGSNLVWIGDTGAHALHQFDLAGSHYRRIVAINSQPILSPVSLAQGPGATFLVCDSVQQSITLLDQKSGELVRDIPLPAAILRPVGVAFDPETSALYVVDAVAHDIKVLDLDGHILRTLGKRGTGPGEFNYPSSIFWDGRRLWVTDSGNHRVQALDPLGNCLTTLGQAGDAPGDMALPKSVALDSEGHVYVVDARFENMQIFTPGGKLLMSLGEEGHGPGQFWLPGGLHIDEHDWIWVCDPYNRRVQVFRYLKTDRDTPRRESTRESTP